MVGVDHAVQIHLLNATPMTDSVEKKNDCDDDNDDISGNEKGK